MIDREKLRSIKTFPSLVKYLRDELDWPINTDDFDSLTFDYEPEELGIDPKTAAKIEEIKQLRPLVTNQPWGIFFIRFEPKQLPVVALRRILSQLVIKKRASSRKPDRPSWNLNDLLLISNYGEGDERQITFAQFTHEFDSADLPTLKVLGWDDADTALHIEHVHKTLNEKLRWPKDEDDTENWGIQWSSAFTLRHREVITTSKELAKRLAGLATRIRNRANRILAIETERGPLRRLHKAFQTALIHDLTEDDFADMYAQTIAYGLLAARVSRPMGIIADNLTDMVPITNPFLREMLGMFLTAGGRKGKFDFDELGIHEVVDLLNSPDTNMEAILRDFGNRKQAEDPVIHFYELFLKEYDPVKKVKRGVFYTPQPVVSYIVRSVHELLQTEFGIEDGLASTITWGEMAEKNKEIKIPEGVPPAEPFVSILDPAAGTATFLVEVIDIVYKAMRNKWLKAGHMELELPALWNAYVPEHLLPRLYGYELMMAPYAIAHMKIGLKLFETGYRFGSDARVRIYLTNSLEPARDDTQGVLEGVFPALAHEAAAVNKVKRFRRFTVIIGNPPYAGHSRNNEIKWIVDLVKDFTRDEPTLQGPGQGKWLQDDYVKFLRLSQYLLAPSQFAILAMITNHRYLTNRTFKGMRRLWRDYFPFTRILDLHGNNVVHEVSPLGYDDNVFEIEQGVAIGIFAKSGALPSSIAHHELWGSRETLGKKGKYDFLESNSASTTKWNSLNPSSPDWLFSLREEVGENLRMEFESGIKMLELMPGALGPNGKPQSGLATMHDSLALSYTIAEVEEKVHLFVKTTSRENAREIFGTLCNPQQWDYASAKQTLSSTSWRKKMSTIWFSPFDIRYTVYDKAVAVHLRRRLSDHFFGRENLGLVIGEAGQEISGNEWDAVSCVNSILQLNYFRRNGSPTLPLYLYDDDLLTGGSGARRVNLSPAHVKQVADCMNMKVGIDSLPTSLAPEDIFYYAYAIFHSPGYRTRYAEFLKIDFPRLPFPGSLELFRDLARLGGQLVALHLLESPKINDFVTMYIGPKNPEVDRVGWSDDTVWLDAVATKKGQPATPGSIGFRGVPEAVWKFHIGGYQVCEKWLKGRKGRTLSKEDINHYQKIVVALSETICLMAEIDKVIDAHGGWPGAFK